MPEGHTIHRAARDQQRLLVGQPLKVISPQGRFALSATLLDGLCLTRIEALGKHLLYHWQDDAVLHVHLGLYGKFRIQRGAADEAPPPRGQVRLRLIAADSVLDLNGPNRCELLDPSALRTLRERLGEDPLRSDADPERLWSRVTKSRRPMGALLLDQSYFAGVGNIYRSEVLHLLGIAPMRPGTALARCEFDRLWQQLCDLMAIGVRYNRIIVADPRDVGKSRGRMTRHERLLIYKRPNCRQCGQPIERSMQAGRQLYACPRCQT